MILFREYIEKHPRQRSHSADTKQESSKLPQGHANYSFRRTHTDLQTCGFTLIKGGKHLSAKYGLQQP
jgi:hypothetical protein